MIFKLVHQLFMVVDKVLKFSLGLIQGELKGCSIVLVGINLVQYLLILLD